MDAETLAAAIREQREALDALEDFAAHGFPASITFERGTAPEGMGDSGELTPAAVRIVLDALEEARRMASDYAGRLMGDGRGAGRVPARAGAAVEGTEGTVNRFGPKAAGHPSVGRECPACHQPFAAGDYTTLVPLGPGDDPEGRQRRDEGRAYNAVALEIHWDCAAEEYR